MAIISRLILIAAVLSSAIALSSCGNQLAKYQSYDLPTYLPNDRSKVKVKVSLNKQRVYVMEGSRMLLAMPVSVGKPPKFTPRGSYEIYYKEAKRRANSHGYAMKDGKIRQTYLSALKSGETFKGTPMPYWCEFKKAYGFHTGWVKHYPCTHGCIRMHENLAPKFYELVSVGTPVYIANSQPEDKTHGDLPLPPCAGPLDDYPKSMYWGDGYFSRHKSPSYSAEPPVGQ